MVIKVDQRSVLIQLAVLFIFVVCLASAVVEFEPESVYLSTTHDGVYQFEGVEAGKKVYKQVSAVIPTGEAEEAVEQYLKPGTSVEFLICVAHDIVMSDLTTQVRKMSEKDPQHSYERPGAVASFNEKIGFLRNGKIVWKKHNRFDALLRHVAKSPKTNVLEEFEQGGLVKGYTRKVTMLAKFGNVQGNSAGFKHSGYTHV